MKARPSYEQIAAAIEDCLNSGLYELELRQDGQPVEEPVWRLGKALEKAGLIDARGVARPVDGRRRGRGERITCPGGCGKTVAVLSNSGRISTHNDDRRPQGSRLCPASDMAPGEVQR